MDDSAGIQCKMYDNTWTYSSKSFVLFYNQNQRMIPCSEHKPWIYTLLFLV